MWTSVGARYYFWFQAENSEGNPVTNAWEPNSKEGHWKDSIHMGLFLSVPVFQEPPIVGLAALGCNSGLGCHAVLGRRRGVFKTPANCVHTYRHHKSTYAKAVKAEFSKDYDAAFRLYIKAAESFLHLSRSVDHDREKTKWKTSAGKALERAEKIKAFVDNSKASSSDPSRSETRLTPVGVDHFSRRMSSQVLR
jgi:hypothetical protein